MLLSQQAPIFDKRGIGCNDEIKEIIYGNNFVRVKHNTCNYCGRM